MVLRLCVIVPGGREGAAGREKGGGRDGGQGREGVEEREPKTCLTLFFAPPSSSPPAARSLSPSLSSDPRHKIHATDEQHGGSSRYPPKNLQYVLRVSAYAFIMHFPVLMWRMLLPAKPTPTTSIVGKLRHSFQGGGGRGEAEAEGGRSGVNGSLKQAWEVRLGQVTMRL